MTDDITNLPHRVSPTRQRMSIHEPDGTVCSFCRLVGYYEAVDETARLTELRPELDEQEKRASNERLAYIADHIKEQPEVSIRHFVPDEQKNGGAIVEISGQVRKISATNGIIVMADGVVIPIDKIIDVSV